MRTETVTLWVLLLASVTSSAQTMTMSLYDYSGLTANETERMTKVTGTVLGHAGISLNWSHCRGALAEETPAACAGDLTANQIVVRLHPHAPKSANVRTERLAVAMVTPDGGCYTTVYVPAVRLLATELRIAFDLALGYAVAHEGGHCLLGPGHAVAGLMRATWAWNDAQQMARLTLGLSRPEALRAAARITSR